MSWKEAMDLAELQRSIRITTIIEGHKILFIWHHDQVHAIQSQCPHFKLPLTKGNITEDNTIVCPFHKSEFNLTTGKANCWSVWPPGVGPLLGKVSKPKNLKIYPTRIEEDKIKVEII